MIRLVGLYLVVLAGAACDGTGGRRRDQEARELRAQGRELFFGRAGCATCHKIGEEGRFIIGPNLGVGDGMDEPLALRAKTRRPELTPIEYVVESIVTPDAFTVATYAPGIMKTYTQPPISLTDEEIIALAAFVAGEGEGVPKLKYSEVATARAKLKALKP